MISIIETRLHKKVAVQKGTRRSNIKGKPSFISGHIEVDLIRTRGFGLASAEIQGVSVRTRVTKMGGPFRPKSLFSLRLCEINCRF